MTTDKILLVTGGSKGIGAAVCRQAVPRGFKVAVNYAHDEAAAAALVGELRAAGGTAIAVQGDIAKAADVERVFDAVDHGLGRLTHLVNNAGTTGRASRLDETDPSTIQRVLDLNVVGLLLAARAGIRRLSPRHGGSGGGIVNISSGAATLGSPGEWVWYAGSKAAVDTITKGLALEVVKEGIRVNAVAPGLIDTELHLSSGIHDRVGKLAPVVPMGRAGTADEVAESVHFLLSDAASYITGSVLRVSGGR